MTANFYGQLGVDKLIKEYFPERTSGCAIEIGAAGGVRGSNTLHFEELGWDVLCIEPNPFFHDGTHRLTQRKNVERVACGAPEDCGDSIPFTIYNIGSGNIMSSLSGLEPDQRLHEEYKKKGLINTMMSVNVKVETLDQVLARYPHMDEIDFVSVDTEGSEIKVLKGMDLDALEIPLLIVENNFDDPEITEYLEGFGYRFDQRYEVNNFYVHGEHLTDKALLDLANSIEGGPTIDWDEGWGKWED